MWVNATITEDSATLTVSTGFEDILGDECDGQFIEVCLTLSGVGEIENRFTIELAPDASSTATRGSDYLLEVVIPEGCPLSSDNSGLVPPNPPSGDAPTDPPNLSITFEPSTGSPFTSCGVLTIINDDIFEDAETIVLEIVSPDPLLSISLTQPIRSTITIDRDIKGLNFALSRRDSIYRLNLLCSFWCAYIFVACVWLQSFLAMCHFGFSSSYADAIIVPSFDGGATVAIEGDVVSVCSNLSTSKATESQIVVTLLPNSGMHACLLVDSAASYHCMCAACIYYLAHLEMYTVRDCLLVFWKKL